MTIDFNVKKPDGSHEKISLPDLEGIRNEEPSAEAQKVLNNAAKIYDDKR